MVERRNRPDLSEISSVSLYMLTFFRARFAAALKSKRLQLLACVLISHAYASCGSRQITQPPAFDYPALLESYFRSNPEGHFPVIIQKGMNTDPAVSDAGYLFYSSDAGGSSDIWMRQLRTTVNLPVVEQAAPQTSPAVSANGRLLAYVSYDRDPSGDILLTQIDPDQIAADAIAGKAPTNLWGSSISISAYIEEQLAAGDPACRGTFADLDPFLSRDGRTLYFASDRCDRGRFRIWRLALNPEGSPRGQAELLCPDAAIQPVAGSTYLVATSLGTNGRPDGFIVYTYTEAKARRFQPSAFRDGLVMRPLLSPDERRLFFLYIPRDTNGDGKLDRNDRGGIYSVDLTDESIQHIVDDSMPVYSIALSSFLRNGILYSAYEGGRARIFLSRPEGLILKQENALDQYLHALTFSDSTRRPLALESVFQFHSRSPEFFLLEADVLAELSQSLQNSRDLIGKAARDLALKAALHRNPFASLALDLHNNSDPSRIEKALQSPILLDLDAGRRLMAGSYLRERLATVLESRGKSAEALAQLEMLNRSDPHYFNRDRTLLREATLQLRLSGKIPHHFREVLSDAKSGDGIKQQILQVIFEEARHGLSGLNPHGESQPLLKGLLFILEGQKAFQARRYEESRRLILTGLQSTGEGNLAYTYGWKLLASIYEIQQQRVQALEARLRFLTSYRRDWNLNVEESDFQRLIDSSQTFIEAYRTSAASIAEDVEDRLDYRLYLIGQVQTAFKNERLPLRLPDRNLLTQFCNSESPSGLLIRNLGYREYLERYGKICGRVQPYLSGAQPDLALEDAEEVSQLFYLVSYANANLINILFLQFRAAGLFDGLHRTWSVHYHRLKADIAIERLKRNLSWEEKQTELLKTGAVVTIFSDRDPFDAKIFDEIMIGYRFAEDDARRHFDLSLLYGYAYLLIRKSEEREAFYDTLPGRGVKLSDSELIRRKEAVLADLKQAEYRLQYIMNIDPGFVDATLLLSWLYQYIDTRKGSPVAQEVGNTEKAFRSVSGMRTSRMDDAIFYREVYQNYFNSRYYERNVDLLTDALDEVKRKASKGQERSLALLNLNLGNNYFQLVNYRAAADAYDAAVDLSRSSHEPIFEGWSQETLFHINRGRARFYAGLTGAAAEDFERAAAILAEKDYWPAFAEANRAYYAYRAESASNYLRARSDRRLAYFVSARYRLAFAQSLRGLAHQENGNPREAIGAYREAIRLLFGADPAPAEAIDRAGLENYVAMAFQDLDEFDRAEVAASSAIESANASGLSNEVNRFSAQTFGGRVIGFLLGYGEDFSVIGEGRTPFGFTPLRQFELALGIRLRNQLRQGDLEAATRVLSERVRIFKSKDGSRRLGREGIVYSLNQKAEIALNQGKFEEAFDLYRESATSARKAGLLKSYSLNFRNSYFVLFRWIESGQYESIRKIDDRISDALDDLVDFREAYRDVAKDAYIKQRQTEDPDFSFTPARDNVALDRIVFRQMGDFTTIEGLLFFYRHQILGRSGSPVTKARDILNRSLELLKKSADLDEGTASISGIRARLNLARVLMAAGDDAGIAPLLERLREETYEFNALPERFELFLVEADLAAARGKPRIVAMVHLAAAESLLNENPFLLPLVIDRLPTLYNRHVQMSLAEGQLSQALALLEELHSYRLQAEFYRYPLEFDNSDAREIHGILRQLRARLRYLASEETRLRLERRNPAALVRERESGMATLRERERMLADLKPGAVAFIRQQPFQIPSASDSGRYVRLITTPESIFCVRVFRGGIRSVSIPPGNVENPVVLNDFAGSCAGQDKADTAIVADAGFVASGAMPTLLRYLRQRGRVALRTTLLDRSPVFIARAVDDRKDGYLFNVNGIGPGGEENVITFSNLPPPLLFARTEGWSARKWVSESHSTALALLSVGLLLPDGRRSRAAEASGLSATWEGISLAYDVFRSSGGGSLRVAPAEIPVDLSALESEMAEGGKVAEGTLVFGTAGFDRLSLAEMLHEKHRAEFARGLSLKPDLSRALRSFELADSYLRGLPDYEPAGAANRMQLAFCLVAVNPVQGAQYFRGLLSRSRESEKRRSLYHTWLMGLAQSGRYEEAGQVLKEALTDQAANLGALDGRILRVLDELERQRPGQIPDPMTLRKIFAGEPDIKGKAAALLYQHGELDAALTLASGSAHPGELSQRIQIEKSFLSGEGLDSALTHLDRARLESDDLILLWHAFHGRWEFFDDFIRSRSGFYAGTEWSQKALLYRILRRRLKDGSTGLEDMTCLTPPKARRGLFDVILFRQLKAPVQTSGCEALTPTEQALMFRMALDTLPLDSTGQVRILLRQLIEAVQTRSTVRASRMAVLVARELLSMRMPDHARRFLSSFSTNPAGTFPSNDPGFADRYAFTVLWERILRGQKPPDRPIPGTESPYGIRLAGALETLAEVRPVRSISRPFLQKLNNPIFDTSDRAMALMVLEARAEKEKDAETYVDLIIARKRLFQGRQDWIPVDDPARRLMHQLPAGQSFSVLHDAGTEFVGLLISNDNISFTSLRRPSASLRARLLAYFQNRPEGPLASDNASLISGEYEALVPDNGRPYLWLTGVHGLAPLSPRKNGLFVIDPDLLLANPVARRAGHFGEDFRVASVDLVRGDNPAGIAYREAIRRIADWTNLDLERLGRPGSRALEIQEGPRRVGAKDWVYLDLQNRPLPDLTPGRPHPIMEGYGLPGRMLQIGGSGVTFRGPAVTLEILPTFLKNYLRADLPAVTVFDRMEYARGLARDADSEDYLFLKAGTASFVE